jgi:hypothetical protein
VIDAPALGVHENVSFAEYRMWDALNISLLCEAIHEDGVCMQRLKAVLDGRIKRKASKALRFGRALHTRLLEPHLFGKWPVASPCSQPFKSGKRKGELCGKPGRFTDGKGLWVCGTHEIEGYGEPEDYLSQKDVEDIETIRRKVFAHRDGRNLHALKGGEVSIVFEMEGVLCKGRLDKYGPGNGVLPDIKKFAADRLTKHRWEEQNLEYHYFVKAAWYVDAIELLTGERNDFQWVVCEDGEPFRVACPTASRMQLEMGRGIYRELLVKYRRAMETQHWPSVFEVVGNDDPTAMWELPYRATKEYQTQ